MNQQKHTIWLAIFFCFHLFGTQAIKQTTQIKNGEQNAIGAGGSVEQTWGFLYRRYFENGFGLSTNFSGWFRKDYGQLSHALGGLFTLKHFDCKNFLLPNSSLRIYLLTYLAYVIRIKSSSGFYNSQTWELSLGPGAGLEFFLNQHISLHLEVPWMTFFALKEKVFDFTKSNPNIGGGLAVYF